MSNDDENLMKQKPQTVEVGYWANRSKKFSEHIEKGLKSAFSVKKPTEKKKKAKDNEKS